MSHATGTAARAGFGKKLARAVPGTALVGAVLLAAAPSSGQPTTLSPEQVAAREIFDEQIKEAVDRAKDKCGAEFKFVADFSAYSEEAWTKQLGKRASRFTVSPCADALTAAARACAGPEPSTGREKGRAPAEPPPPPVAVKGVTCTFSGASPKQNRREDDEVHHRRNASFAAGELTLRISPDFVNGSSYTYDQVIRGIALPGSVAAGAACTKDYECSTRLCEAGTCQACSKKVKCHGRSELCGDGGSCYTPLPPNHGRSSRPAGGSSGSAPKKGGKGLGQGCKSTSECEEGRVCTQKTPKLRTCQ